MTGDEELRAAAREVVHAVTVKGTYPEWHDRALARLKADWPTLANALDRLVQVTIEHGR